MPKGTMFMYHAQDKHIETPGSEITDTRGGNTISVINFKPIIIIDTMLLSIFIR
jgi:nitrate reductase alpha subunit